MQGKDLSKKKNARQGKKKKKKKKKRDEKTYKQSIDKNYYNLL